MALGDYLKELRLQRNLSGRKAAQQLGISYTRLQELESGVSRSNRKPTSPSTDLLIKIAQGYQVPLPVLLDLAGMTEPSQDAHQEAELVQLFRSLDRDGRDLAIALIRTVKDQRKC